MATTATLRSLPYSLLILLVVCLTAPVWSLIALASPLSVWEQFGPWAATLLVFSYWILPPVMALAIVMRSPVFLPVFVSECIALILYVAIYGSSSSATSSPESVMLWGRYAAIGLTALAGVFVSSKDLIAPFLSVRGAEWRKTPRLPSSIKMFVRMQNSPRPVEIIVDDFSLSGMAVSMPLADVRLDRGIRRGDALQVIDTSNQSLAVDCQIAWVKKDGPLVSFGLKALNLPAMASLVQSFKTKRKGLVLPFWVGRLWLNPLVRRATLVIWATLILAAFGAPALNHNPKPQGIHWTQETVPPVTPR